jgi:hypothetical protein
MQTRQPSPEPGCSQIRKGLASPLCVLGDLCGLNSSGMRALISSHRGHRVHREMLPDAMQTRQPSPEPGCSQIGTGLRLPSVSSVSSVAHTILTGCNMVLGWTHPLARRRIGQKRNFDHQPKRRRSWAARAADYLRDCIVVFEEYGWDWTSRAYHERDGWIPEHGRDRDDPQPAMQATVWVKRFQLWDNNGMQGAQS